MWKVDSDFIEKQLRRYETDRPPEVVEKDEPLDYSEMAKMEVRA